MLFLGFILQNLVKGIVITLITIIFLWDVLNKYYDTHLCNISMQAYAKCVMKCSFITQEHKLLEG